MSESAQRPWWASEGRHVDPDEDPVERHRSARRGEAGAADAGARWGEAGAADAGARAEDAWTDAIGGLAALVDRLADGVAALADVADGREAGEREAGGDGGTADGDRRTGGGHAHAGERPATCGICPICTGLRVLGEARPDLVRHLSEAGRHLGAALRDLAERPPSDDDRPDRLERIDLD